MDAMLAAPDPGAMVLDAIKWFYSSNFQDLHRLRKVCAVLLEVLMKIRSNLSNEVGERPGIWLWIGEKELL
uniref:FRIGIDA-like protein n=1 Tax=Rhizophora mucronata TaxID=61149 RepID=A0A2P2PAT2_RHIMU